MKDIDKLIEKALKGEGSRGGKVIGHTASGKPIYAPKSGMVGRYIEQHHGHFSPGDHKSAYSEHAYAAKQAKKKGDMKSYEAHRDAAGIHWHMGEGGKASDYYAGRLTGMRNNPEIERHDSGIPKDPKHKEEFKHHARKWAAAKDRERTVDNAMNPTDIQDKLFKDKDELSYADKETEDKKKKPGENYEQESERETYVKKALDGLLGLIKGGEGSRGGKVIGHTRSGKPIYCSGSHKNFKPADHLDAYHAHHFMTGSNHPSWKAEKGKDYHSRAYKKKSGHSITLADESEKSKDHAFSQSAKSKPSWMSGKAMGSVSGHYRTSRSGDPVYVNDYKHSRSSKGAYDDHEEYSKQNGGHEKDMDVLDMSPTDAAKEIAKRHPKMTQKAVVGYYKMLKGKKCGVVKAMVGPGSRGGRIIGYTKSKKPIYDSHGHKAHKHFDKEDHAEASWRHMREARKHYDVARDIESNKSDTRNANKYHARAAYHLNESDKHYKSSTTPSYKKAHSPGVVPWKIGGWTPGKEKGEGSRGGKVIGRTKSGKPIYAPHHDAYASVGHGLHEGSISDHAKARKKHFRTHYPGWTRNDHDDAATHHYGEAKRLKEKRGKLSGDYVKNKGKITTLRSRADEHIYAGNQHGIYGYGGKKPSRMSNKPV